MRLLYRAYRSLFARPRYRRLNNALFRMGLHGLGVLNFESSDVSGESHFVSRILPMLIGGNQPVFFDVGANVGHFSSLLLRRFPTARLYAFEPHPKTYSRLTAAISLDGRVKTRNVGIGDKRETLMLYDDANLDGSSHASLYESVISELHGKPVVSTLIRVETLDAVASEENIAAIDYLKIDTEGHELAVLKGAARMLSEDKITCIQFEFNEMNVESRVFLRDFRRLLPKHDLYRLLPRGMIRIEEFPLSSELFAYQNVIAIRKSTQAKFI
ncbi:MAG: FkbM family methyltransferase [Steroidobacteraceae bacterium]